MRAWLALMAALAVAAAMPSVASAKHHRAKHHRVEAPVIASGATAFGVPWQATASNGSILFSVDSRNRYKRGWLDRLSLPSTPPNVFTARVRPNIDPRPEEELAGTASPNVAMLAVHMADGSILEVYPTAPPPSAQNRLHFLSQIQVFDAFFPSGGPQPQTITAFDANNNVLAERAANSDGSF
jgi:hypothetical protein